ncbi:hypothetical protein Tco_1508394 [Tanacetum coccineum]
MINNIDGEFKLVMEIPDTMINDTIKQSVGYKVYQSKKKQSEEEDAQEELEKQNVSTVKKGRGKGYMCLGNKEVNVSSKPKKDVVPRRKRTITYADNLLETEDEAVLLAKSVSTEEQRHQQQGIMTQLVIEKEVNIEFEEGFAAEKGKKLKAKEEGLVRLKMERLNTSQILIVMQQLALHGQVIKMMLKNSDMDISDDDSDKGDDDASRF